MPIVRKHRHRTPSGAAALLLASLVLPPLAACGDASGPSAIFRVTDSAGVMLAVSAAPRWAANPDLRWSLSPEPLLDLTRTGSGPGHEFYRVRDALRLPDGRIVVADGGSSQIRVYGTAGDLLAVTGREGEGPGEYRQISAVMAMPGDSLAVFSWPTRMTVLGPDLEVARTLELEHNARRPEPLGREGFAAALTFASVIEYEGASGLIREPVPIARYSWDGGSLDTLALAPGFEEYMVAQEEGASAARPLFGKAMTLATRGAELLVGEEEGMGYRVVDASGRVTARVRVPGYDLSLTADEIEAERQALLGTDPPPFWRDVVDALPEPETRPAFTELLVDTEGYVWAGGYQSRVTMEEPRAWEIFDPEGRWLGSLATPPRFTVFRVGRDWILGSWSDALDVEHVRLLPLRRGDAGGGSERGPGA